MFQNISALNDPRAYLQSRLNPGKSQTAQTAVARPEAAATTEERPLTGVASQKLVNQQMINALKQALGQEGTPPLESLKAEDFTPEKVADRILGFIKGVLGAQRGQGGGDARFQSLLQQARDGVEKGFNEAMGILDGLGVLKDEGIAGDLDRTHALLQKGLDDLAQGEISNASSSQAGFQMLAASEERSLSLEVRTRDGDRITLSLEQRTAASSTQMAARDDQGSIFARVDQFSSSFALEYRVEGDLDEGEQAALKDLLQGINKVADSFYGQGGPAALAKALELGYDDNELAGFSLEMNQTQTLQATQAYRSVSRLGPSESGGRPADSLLKPFANLANDLRALFEETQPAQWLVDPKTSLVDLLGQRIQGDSRYPDHLGRLGNRGQDLLQGVLQRLITGSLPQPDSTSNTDQTRGNTPTPV